MRPLLLLVLLVGCGPRSAVPGSGDLVAGTVVAVDTSPMAYDGDALLRLRIDTGQTLTVRVPARTNLCAAEGLGIVGELRPGDRVEVRGTADAEGNLRPCTEPHHVLQRAAS